MFSNLYQFLILKKPRLVFLTLILITSFFLFNKYIGNIDLVVVLVGISWSSFLIIPNSFHKERDFFFIFINLLASFFNNKPLCWKLDCKRRSNLFCIKTFCNNFLNYNLFYWSSGSCIILVNTNFLFKKN